MKYTKKITKYLLGIAGILLLGSTSSIFAASVEEVCFETLKENVSQVGVFEEPYKTLRNLNYSTLSNQFSRYYKNTSSFGVDLDEALFELRLYSFGRQTGYIHPPYSPFIDYSKTEKWDTPAKEYIVAEEYVTLPSGERQFVSCSFMKIGADDLLKVTAENYLYDGEIVSLVKTNPSLDYKAWYNENVSYNYEGESFVSWNRLFIYLQATQNEYFDKYTVIESFPTNVSDSFGVLAKPEQIDESQGDGAMRVYVSDETGKILDSLAPDELSPVKREGNNEIFPFFSYYQAIENAFPEFAKHLALRGEIHFNTLKDVVGTKDNEKYAHIWNTILDPKGFTKYVKAKQDGTSEEKFSEGEITFYEANLDIIGNMETDIEKAENTAFEFPEGTDTILGIAQIEDTQITTETSSSNIIYLIVGVLLLLIGGLFIYKKRK